MDWTAFRLSLALGLATLAVLMPLAVWLGRVLAHRRFRGRGFIEAVVALPLVLPPTVLGFYLLVAFGAASPLGQAWQSMFGHGLAFSFEGLLLASLIANLPFAVQPIQHAFESIGPRPLEAAATLRASPFDAFFSVALPLARPGLLTAAILSFAHTVGEFGVVLMIGGNIPGKTRVVSTQIYGHVEAMEYAQAHWLAGGMVAFSFAVLLCLALLKRNGASVVR